SANRLFHTVSTLSKEAEALIEDADYLSFHAFGMLASLRAATIALRTSQALWTSIHVADALRTPALRNEAVALIIGAEQIARRADRGEDVAADLEKLEKRYRKFAIELDQEACVDSGAASGVTAIQASRKVWRYRSDIESAVLERTGKEGPLT